MNQHNRTIAAPAFATVKEAADLYKVDPTTIRRWIAQGILSAVRIGSTTLRVDLDSLVTEPIGFAA